MADLERLNAPPVPPQQIEQRRQARLRVAEWALTTPQPRPAQAVRCGSLLSILGLWPAQDHEHVPSTVSRGMLTNSTMVQTPDARRRAGKS